MALIKCPECGKEISDTAKSCVHCGKILIEEQPTTKIYSDVEKENQNTTVETTEPKPPNKKRKKILKISIVIVCILIVLVPIGYNLYYKFYPTPFDKLNFNMSRDEIHKVLGEPDEIYDSNGDSYDTKFAKTKWFLRIQYYSNKLSKHKYVLVYHYDESKKLKDIKEVQSIIKIFNKKYGNYSEVNDNKIYWETKNKEFFILNNKQYDTFGNLQLYYTDEDMAGTIINEYNN